MHRLNSVVALVVLLSLAGCSSEVIADMDAAVSDAGSFDAASRDATSAPDASTALDSGMADAAATDGGAARDGGPILPPVDGGDPFGDAGPLGTPAWVDLEVLTRGECTPVAACGGAVLGTWDVTGGCVAVPIEDAISECPGAAVTRRSGRGRGRVHFDGAIARRVAQSEVVIEVRVPSLCASFVGGCPGIESLMRMQAPDSACATGAGGDCNCAVRQLTAIDDTDAYTTTATQIVGSVKRWDYCISGDSLSYEDASPSGPREPGVIVLGRR